MNVAAAITVAAASATRDEPGTNDTVANNLVAVVVLDPLTAAVESRFIGHQNNILSIRFSSDGQRMVTGSVDRNAIIWDVATGAILHTINEFSIVREALFTPDGSAVLTIIEDDTPALWQTEPLTLAEGITWTLNNRAVRPINESECRRYQLENFCN
jgi:WD40 repeat protein